MEAALTWVMRFGFLCLPPLLLFFSPLLCIGNCLILCTIESQLSEITRAHSLSYCSPKLAWLMQNGLLAIQIRA